MLLPVQLAFGKASVAEGQVPVVDDGALRSAAKSSVNKQFVDGLRDAANFSDYQVLCRLMTKKEAKWKDFGAANIFFKQKQLFRAVISSSDYRNGSVVVKGSDGSIRGKGGGTLTFVKMTIQPDSRTIRLPTGYSLVESDFFSLYDSLKTNIGKGVSAFTSPAPVNLKPFKEPVLVLVLNSGPQPDSPISEVVFLDPRTKLPLVWNTYKDGQPHAVVMFEELQPNKGLSDDLFHL
jgi:outer membrane lipoprotein-sorting protein